MYQMSRQQPANQLQPNGKPNFNAEQFRKWLPQLNDSILQQLQQEARRQGISDKDIQEGMNIITSMRQGF